MKRAAAFAGAAFALAGCGSDSGSAVAHVGDTVITKGQLQQAVDHFKDEAAAEGRPFPKSGTDAYRTVERQALGLLVYRSELLQSADKLGIPVDEQEVQTRLQASGEEAAEAGAFARETVRAQIAYEHIYERVTAGSTPAGREAAMRKWLEQMKRAYARRVSYEAEFAPAS